MKRLALAQTGDELIYLSAQGGMGVKRKLTDMGLIPGEKIKVLHNSGVGQVTVSIKGSRVAIGHGLAERISVRKV